MKNKIKCAPVIFFILIITPYFLQAHNIKLGFLYENSGVEEYKHILNPVFYIDSSGSGKNILLARKSNANKENRFELLYPLFSAVDNSYKRETQLFGIFNITDYKNGLDCKSDKDFIFFPSIMTGKDAGKLSYFCVFPIAGNLKGKLGKDEIDFLFFPLYMRTKYQGIIINHYAYPLFASGHSKTGSQYVYKKIFPFYSTEKTNKKISKNIFWPFYRTETSENENGSKYNSFSILFIYGEDNNKTGKYISYFYPFIKFKKNHSDKYLSVFPFYERIIDAGIIKKKYCFLAGKTFFPEKQIEKKYFFYPLITRYDDKTGQISKLNILPFYKSYKELNVKKEQFFPFIKIKKINGLIVEANILALDLFLNETSVEKNYARFWRIFNFSKKETGTKADLLYKTFEYANSNESTGFSFFPLFSIIKNKETNQKRLKLLFNSINLNF
ncbi:MAG TPA: hypothetical protein PLQ81_13135 [bacterium]|nr:hypothetical protein [bacterium]